jgi:ABC-type glycerol-3-phosphate transport system permease component
MAVDQKKRVAKKFRWQAQNWLLTLALLGLAVIFLIPAWGVLFTSLRTDADIAFNGVWAPSDNVTVDNYLSLIFDVRVHSYMRNSFLVTIPATIISIAMGTLAGYTIAKLRVRGGNLILLVIVSGLFIPPQILLIPLFQLFNFMGLYDTLWPMIIVHSAYGLSLCTLVMRNFFDKVPDELLEAALMDGASHPRILWSVALPLSRPALGALATLQFTFIWNDFLYPLIFTRSEEAQTIMVGILSLGGQYSTAFGAQAALSVIASLPTLLVFFIFQKQFIKGLTAGAVKG